MSASHSDDQVSDQNTAVAVSNGNGTAAPTIASWDEGSLLDMLSSIIEAKGVFSAADAQLIEERMRAKGHNFTWKQIQTKSSKIRAKANVGKPAASHTAATAAATEPKVKTPRKRAPAKKAPELDAEGKPVVKAKGPARKRAPAKKAAATATATADAEGGEVEAQSPPNKKRKAAAAGGKKKTAVVAVSEEKVDEEGEDASGSDGNVEAQGEVVKATEDAEMAEYDAPEGEGEGGASPDAEGDGAAGQFAEALEDTLAVKQQEQEMEVDIEVETVQMVEVESKTVVQTSA